MAEDKKEGAKAPAKVVFTDPIGPKTNLFESTPAIEADKENYHRYINIKSSDNALRRQAQGYTIVPESEGGHRIGDEMALAKTSRANYEARTKAKEKLGRERLDAHKSEVQQAVESVVRELRDKHGISVDEKRLFVNE